MKIRACVTAAVLVCMAATAVADLSPEFVEWGKGPLQFLLTKEEAAAWKGVRTDAEAKAFVDLFWARRDPTAGTPRNEYRELIEARIKYADDTFKDESVRGALTDRGKVFLLYGAPKRAERIASGGSTSTMERPNIRSEESSTVGAVIQWTYEGDDAQAVFNNSRAVVRFVDRLSNQQYKLEKSRLDMARAQERAVERTIAQPALTAAPTFEAPASAPAPVAQAPAPPPVVTELTTEAFKTAVAEAKSTAFTTWGEYVTSYGQYFVPVGLYIPKSAGVSSTDATFFGVVQDADGKNVLAFEEPAKLTATKDDFFVDKSLSLPQGKYRGVFGVAQNGKVIALGTADMQLAGALDKDATAISQLILSNNVFPLTAAQNATDPFAFGGVRIIPKADRTFRASDELWYFFELRNPGLAEPALPEGTVAVNPVEVPRMPKIQVKMDVAGQDKDGKPVKMAAPPREVEAMEMKGVPGHYGVGNAIPLATFRPGEYTFTVKVIDTIKKTSYTLSEKFKVVE